MIVHHWLKTWVKWTGSRVNNFLKKITPGQYMVIVNVVCTAIGFAQGLINARILGAENYGVIAIIAGINATVLNFLDVRLIDLAGRLYYRSDLPADVDQKAYRAGVLQVTMAGNTLIALGLCLLGGVVNFSLVHLFTAAPIQPYWIVLQTLSLALVSIGNTFTFLQRFSERFYLMGAGRFVNQLANLAIFLPIILLNPNIGGYYFGLFSSTVIVVGLTAALTLYIWRRLEGYSLSLTNMRLALPDYRKNIRFLFMGNLLGYTKLFHRGADVLLVGLFADDRMTGIYKFARSLTDGFYVLFDALNQVYYPRFLNLLQQKLHPEYRRLAGRILGGTAVFTAIVVALEALLLSWIIDVFLAGRFAGAELPIIILTLPFLFVNGVYMWVWPILVHTGKITRYTGLNYLALIVQYAGTYVLFRWLEPDALYAALGYAGHYLVMAIGAIIIVSRILPQAIPVVIKRQAEEVAMP